MRSSNNPSDGTHEINKQIKDATSGDNYSASQSPVPEKKTEPTPPVPVLNREEEYPVKNMIENNAAKPTTDSNETNKKPGWSFFVSKPKPKTEPEPLEMLDLEQLEKDLEPALILPKDGPTTIETPQKKKKKTKKVEIVEIVEIKEQAEVIEKVITVADLNLPPEVKEHVISFANNETYSALPVSTKEGDQSLAPENTENQLTDVLSVKTQAPYNLQSHPQAIPKATKVESPSLFIPLQVPDDEFSAAEQLVKDMKELPLLEKELDELMAQFNLNGNDKVSSVITLTEEQINSLVPILKNYEKVKQSYPSYSTLIKCFSEKDFTKFIETYQSEIKTKVEEKNKSQPIKNFFKSIVNFFLPNNIQKKLYPATFFVKEVDKVLTGVGMEKQPVPPRTDNIQNDKTWQAIPKKPVTVAPNPSESPEPETLLEKAPSTSKPRLPRFETIVEEARKNHSLFTQTDKEEKKPSEDTTVKNMLGKKK